MKKDHYRKLYIGFDVSSKKIEVYARTADEDKGVSMQIENSKNSIKEFLEKLPSLKDTVIAILLPQFNTCSSSGVFDRLLMKKSFDLLRLFLNASHMGFCMFFKLSIPFCRRSFGKGRFQIPVQ